MRKQKSKSGRTSWIEPEVIMENSTRKLELRPNYFERSSGQEELVLGIDVYLKKRTEKTWTKNEAKSFSLRAETAENFFQAISKFRALKGKEDEKEYIVAGIENVELLADHSPQQLLTALGKALSGAHEQFQTLNIEAEISAAIQSHLRYSTLTKALSTLREMMGDSSLSEAPYQKWFEENYWVFGSAYIARDDVRSISSSDNTDLILERTANGLRDIIEVKKASLSVLVEDTGRKQFYFSANVSSAIGQCARYLEVFSQTAHNGLLDHPKVIAKQPVAVIVIGRSNDWTNEQRSALHRLNSHLHGIRVKTYDEIVEEAECLLSMIGTKGKDIPEIEKIPF